MLQKCRQQLFCFDNPGIRDKLQIVDEDRNEYNPNNDNLWEILEFGINNDTESDEKREIIDSE